MRSKTVPSTDPVVWANKTGIAKRTGRITLSISSFLVLLCGELGDDVHVFESSDVAGDGIVGNNFTEQPAHDLAAAGFGKRVGETDLFGPGEGPDFVRHPLAQVFAQL